jgi:DDE superfamily endonuclease
VAGSHRTHQRRPDRDQTAGFGELLRAPDDETDIGVCPSAAVFAVVEIDKRPARSHDAHRTNCSPSRCDGKYRKQATREVTCRVSPEPDAGRELQPTNPATVEIQPGQPRLRLPPRGPAHRAKKTKAFVATLAGRLQLFFLPPYSPDRNPDELVSKHLKTDTVGHMVVTDKTDFKR